MLHSCTLLFVVAIYFIEYSGTSKFLILEILIFHIENLYSRIIFTPRFHRELRNDLVLLTFYFTDKKSIECNVFYESCTLLFKIETMGTIMSGLSSSIGYGSEFGEGSFLFRSKPSRTRIL